MASSLHRLLTEDSARIQAGLRLEKQAARIEVQMLLQAVLKVSQAYLLAHPERLLDESETCHYQALLQRRLAGEPMAYLLGEKEFYGLKLKVTPDTLIPRPETELLVELALLRMLPRQGVRVLDLGTGCGAIALAIAHTRPDVEMIAVDISAAALEVACGNARRLELRNVGFQCSDWFSALKGQQFDLIVSNPPYIAASDRHLTEGDVRFEPRQALVAGEDGLDDIRHIIARAHEFLPPQGWLLLEHGHNQAAAVRRLLELQGFAEVFSACDLAGIERASGGKWPG